MTTITIRLNEEDKKLFQEFSSSKGLTVSDWARESLIEKIEDEYDLEVVREYMRKKEAGEIKFYSSDEVKEMLDL